MKRRNNTMDFEFLRDETGRDYMKVDGAKYYYSHTSTRRGYVSRKGGGYITVYKGRFGHGYIHSTSYTTQYCHYHYYLAPEGKINLSESVKKLYAKDIQEMYDNFSVNIKTLCNQIDDNIDKYSIEELNYFLRNVVKLYDYIAVNMQIENGEDDEEYDTLHEADFISDYRDKLRVALNIADDDGDIIERLIYDSSYDELESKLDTIGYADDYKKYITAEIRSFDLHRD